MNKAKARLLRIESMNFDMITHAHMRRSMSESFEGNPEETTSLHFADFAAAQSDKLYRMTAVEKKKIFGHDEVGSDHMNIEDHIDPFNLLFSTFSYFLCPSSYRIVLCCVPHIILNIAHIQSDITLYI